MSMMFGFFAALSAAQAEVLLDLWTTSGCSGAPNQTVVLSRHNESNCRGCWDRCAAGMDARSMRLRADSDAAAAININCVGKYTYAGGWSDASLGGVITTASGCHDGGASAVVLCTGTAYGMQDDLGEVCGAAPAPPNTPIAPLPFSVLDPAAFAPRFGRDARGAADFAWARLNVLFVDMGAAPLASALGDAMGDVLQTYYYRWRVFRRHLKWTAADGWVLTEFLPYVPWAGRHNTIPAAAGHHIAEGTWLLDPRPVDDYTAFWYKDGADPAGGGGGDPTTYTSWIAHAAWRRALVTGNTTGLVRARAAMARSFRERIVPNHLATVNVDAGGSGRATMCWRQDDGADAMEVSVSGPGCRPTIAAALYGEASAIAAAFALPPANASARREFERWANLSRAAVLDVHWNTRVGTFAVVPLAGTPSTPASAPPACNLSAVRRVNRTVDVRELLGFSPWYWSDYSLPAAGEGGGAEAGAGAGAAALAPLLPRAWAQRRSAGNMWAQLFDSQGLAGSYGLRTVERRSSCYNYSYEHGDCWNGPSWPYETARVLTGAANALNLHSAGAGAGTGAGAGALNSSSYWSLLAAYARQHTRSRAVNDTAATPGAGHVFENLHADEDYWNNRARMYSGGSPQRNQGDDYFHSSFADIVISGLLGLRPQPGRRVVINPLVPPGTAHFALDHVRYKNRMLALFFDADGSRYGRGAGLTLLVDGRVAAHSDTVQRLEAEV
eukprot:g7048.t1